MLETKSIPICQIVWW